MVSKSWNLLDKTERAKWEDLARQDKDRYEREKAAYKGPWKVPDIKYDDGPKKPMSAFLAFGNERRKEIAANNPLLSNAEISSLLSKLWRECPDDIKQAYRDREARERKEFKKQREEWERMKQREAGIDFSVDRDNESDSQSFESSDQKVSYMDTINVASPQRFSFTRRTDASASMTLTRPAQSTIQGNPIVLPQLRPQSRQSIEEYSLDSLLADEELFEDFSPHDAPQTAPFVNSPH